MLEKIKGISLQQLLVVILILSILSLLALINIKDFSEKSKISIALENKSRVQIVVDRYYLKNNVLPVTEPQNLVPGLPQQPNWELLKGEYLNKIPQDTNAIYYWVDFQGKVWVSDIDAPTGVSVQPDTPIAGTTTITWDNVNGAIKYEIGYYDNEGKYTKIGTVNNNENLRLETTEDLTDKIPVVSSISDNFQSVPVTEGYMGSNLSNNQQNIQNITPIPPFIKNYGGWADDRFYAVEVTSDGGYIAVGFTTSSITDSGNYYGYGDFLIAKLDKDGNKEWIRSYGGTNYDYLYSVQETNDGGYIAVGYSLSNDYDLEGINPRTGSAIIIKVDSDGNILWIKNYGDGDYAAFYSIEKTKDNGYIISGNNFLNWDKNFYIIKLDSQGNEIWAKTYGGSNYDYLYSIKQTNDGGYIAVGTSSSNDGDLNSNNGSDDFVIAKFDANGNKEWIKSYGTNSRECFKSVQQINDGFIAVGSSLSMGPIYDENFVIAKFDLNGEQEWLKTYGGSQEESFESVIVTSNNEYIAVGQTYSNDLDIPSNKGEHDFVIAKFDANGNKQWIKTYGGTQFDHLMDIKQTIDNGFVAVGYSDSEDYDIPQNNGMYDCIIIKFNENGELN